MTSESLPLAPDTILHSAKLYTVDPAQPWAEAVAVRNGEIVAVGTSADVLSLAGEQTVCIDMGNRLALPGFCDAHIHFLDWCLAQNELSFYEVRSKQEMMNRVHERSRACAADAWIVGRGWNESWWGDAAYPVAADLDAVTNPNQAAIFFRTDMHSAVVNSRAMALAGISSASFNPHDGVIEKDAHGEPTGILKESAIDLVADLIPEPTHAQAIEGVHTGIAALHRIGVTAVHDQRISGPGGGTLALRVYQELNAHKELRMRINCNFAAYQLPCIAELGLRYGIGDDRLRLGHVKVFADGSLGSQTALMLAPFATENAGDAPNTGVRLAELAQIAEWFRMSARQGFPISIHAIGDRANREVLDLFEELVASTPAPGAPHRIEHVQIIDGSDVGRLGALGITASVQPVHVIDDMAIADRLLGERAANLYRFQTLLETGAVLAFGSDAPVADPNPFLGIHAALYRQRPESMVKGAWYEAECVSLESAIFAYTMGPALAANWQDVIGSISPGKRADIIALDRNLFDIAGVEVQGTEISGTQVDFVMFDGVVTVNSM